MCLRGLREIKREATAQALAESAFELALERGMDGFVIADVTDRAGYSRRTFANHFSCKEEAVASILLSDVDGLTAHITDVPDGTSLLDALHRMMRSQLSADMFDRLRKLVTLCSEHPALEPHILAAVRHIRQAAPAALSEFAKGRYSDEYILVLFAAAYGTISLLFDGSLDVLRPGEPAVAGSNSMTFDQFLDTTFAHLRNGF